MTPGTRTARGTTTTSGPEGQGVAEREMRDVPGRRSISHSVIPITRMTLHAEGATTGISMDTA